MKKEDFLSVINDIDDSYIKEAMEYKAEEKEKEKSAARSVRPLWLRYGTLAAACLILVIAAAGFFPDKGGSSVSDPDGDAVKTEEKVLPQLSVEHYTAKSREPEKKLGNPSKDKDGNPWAADAAVEALPVYENLAYAKEADRKAVPVDDQVLDEEIQATAQAVNMTVENIDYSRGAEETAAFKAMAQTDRGTITATCSNFTKIEYSEPEILPEEYRVETSEMTVERAEVITEYLLDEYGQLMGFSNPKASVRMFYDQEGTPRWILAGYDDSEDLQEQIVSYNLKRMRFELNEQGDLISIVMMDNLASGKMIEEYPIITAEEAKALLGAGEYVTSNSESPELSNIEKAALVYLTGPECNIFMPYYAFDVRIDEEDGELIHYSTYYVPAVRAEYLNKMPTAEETEEKVE